LSRPSRARGLKLGTLSDISIAGAVAPLAGAKSRTPTIFSGEPVFWRRAMPRNLLRMGREVQQIGLSGAALGVWT